MMDRVLLTCEHGGAEVPAKYRGLFRSRAAQSALRSHRGSDHGALWLAKTLQRSLRAPLLASTVTRLLVDLNRSLGHPQLFSEFSRPLDPAARVSLLESLYYPHRDRVESWIREQSGLLVTIGACATAGATERVAYSLRWMRRAPVETCGCRPCLEAEYDNYTRGVHFGTRPQQKDEE